MSGNGIAQIRHRLCRELIKKSKRILANCLEISFRSFYFVPLLNPKNAKNGKFDLVRSTGNGGRDCRPLFTCYCKPNN